MSVVVELQAKPSPVLIDLNKTALIMIDMQKDFLEPGGFGSSLGNDVSKLQRAILPCKAVLQACRDTQDDAKVLVIHTREGHRPDMTDVTPHKKVQTKHCIGTVCKDNTENGRILIRGEPGHDIIQELYPLVGVETIIDKPGKGSFYATDLDLVLKANGIETLLVCGVTTEVCVHTTIREANDRGYHCIAIEDACASYSDEFHAIGIQMIWAQGGIFGSVSNSETIVKAIQSAKK